MRVLLAHKFFRVVGGAEVFFFETGRLLEESGHEVCYLSTAHQENKPSVFTPYFVDAHDYARGGLISRVGALNSAIYSRNAKSAARRLIHDFRPDVAHMFGIATHLSTSVVDACADAGVPVVMSCNDYKHICPNYQLFHHGRICEDCKGGRFYNAVRNRCCHDSVAFSAASMLEAYSESARGSLRKRVDLFLFASDFMANKTSEFWGDGSFSYQMLRNPFSAERADNIGNGDYVIFFGRLTEEKGVAQLLEAAALLPEVPFVIVGDGPCDLSLRAQAAEAGLQNVEFLGPRWGKELQGVLGGARLVVVPSMWHENFPYVILQAFAAGKPVVGSDRGGIPELIGDSERGLVYAADRPDLLADAVQQVWSATEERQVMGRRARAYVVDEYSEDSFLSSLMEAYGRVWHASSQLNRSEQASTEGKSQ